MKAPKPANSAAVPGPLSFRDRARLAALEAAVETRPGSERPEAFIARADQFFQWLMGDKADAPPSSARSGTPG